MEFVFNSNRSVTEMAEALESSRKRSPADETAIHREAAAEDFDEDQTFTDAAEDFAGDQIFTDAEASPETEGNPQMTLQKHELEHSWTFWFDNPSYKSKQETWGSSIHPVHTFSTVEDFWGLYNNFKPPSQMPVGTDFHCFKHGIEPKWEDPVCANGGKWAVISSLEDVDKWWMYTLLALIGEQFDHGDEVCGAVLNVRAKFDKISIWTKNAFDEAAQMSIGKQFKELFEYNETIGFTVHDDAKKLDKNATSRYFV